MFALNIAPVPFWPISNSSPERYKDRKVITGLSGHITFRVFSRWAAHCQQQLKTSKTSLGYKVLSSVEFEKYLLLNSQEGGLIIQKTELSL